MATTPNFGWPTPDDTDQLSDGAAAIRNLGDAIDASVASLGIGVTVASSDTIDLDFGTGDEFLTRTVSGTDVEIAATQYEPGRTKTVRIIGGADVASLSVPSEWVFVGQAAGTAIAAETTVLITAISFGTAETDVVATFSENG